MNTTSAAIAMKISAWGFTSLSPNIPADIVPTSGATESAEPEGAAAPPPETLTLTDVTPGAVDGCDGVPKVDGVNGCDAGLSTGSFGIEIGTLAMGADTGRVAVGSDGAAIPNVRCSGVSGVRGASVVGAVYAILPPRYDTFTAADRIW